MTKSSKQKNILGSVTAIPLPDGRYTYIKTFKDHSFGIYNLVSSEILPFSEVIQNSFSFYQSGTDAAIKNGEWIVIGIDPFVDEDSAWTPPQATCYDRETNKWTMGGIPRVDDKGQMRVATLEEVRGLDILSACHKPELLIERIVDRLINGNHDDYKVRS